MNTKDQIKTILAYYRAHKVETPRTGGLAVCSCGARWNTYFSAYGLEWEPLNEKCQGHNAAYNELPKGKCGHTLETNGQEVYCPTCG